MKKIILIILITGIALAGVTCALSVADKKATVGPDVDDAPYVVATMSRMYYIVNTDDFEYNPDIDTNTIYRYWHTVDGKWKYSEDVMVLPVSTFGPADVKLRATE